MTYELVEKCTRALERYRAEKRRAEVLDGHQVTRIVWQTEHAIVFEDEAGRVWRYLYSWRRAWPVLIGGRPA